MYLFNQTRYTRYLSHLLLNEHYPHSKMHILNPQIMAIEIARNILNIPDSDSIEFNSKTVNPIIIHMNDLQVRMVDFADQVMTICSLVSKWSEYSKIIEQVNLTIFTCL